MEMMDSLNFSIGDFVKIKTCIGCMNKHENMCFDLASWILKPWCFLLIVFILFYFS
jgi:hypothetical protein